MNRSSSAWALFLLLGSAFIAWLAIDRVQHDVETTTTRSTTAAHQLADEPELDRPDATRLAPELPGTTSTSERSAARSTTRVENRNEAVLIVLDAQTREPIEGARVTELVRNGRAIEFDIERSDEGGRIAVGWNGAAPSGARIQAAGYADASVPAIPFRPGAGAAEIHLDRPGTLLVRPVGFGESKGDLRLHRGRRLGNGPPESVRPLSGDAPVTFEELEPGFVSVVAIVTDRPIVTELGVLVRSRDVTTVDLHAPEVGTFSGTVVEIGSERPVEHVGVKLEPIVSGVQSKLAAMTLDRVSTDARGKFRVPGVPPGRMRVHLYPPDGLHLEREIVIADGDVARERKFRVRGHATLSGRIEAPPGVELASVKIAAVSKGDARGALSRTLGGSSPHPGEEARGVDERGGFLLDIVPAARPLVVIARADEMQIAHLEIDPPLATGESRDDLLLKTRAPEALRRSRDRSGGASRAIDQGVHRRRTRGFIRVEVRAEKRERQRPVRDRQSEPRTPPAPDPRGRIRRDGGRARTRSRLRAPTRARPPLRHRRRTRTRCLCRSSHRIRARRE